mgnify:FL=1
MRSIHIKASREYDVLVERGLLDRAGELLREVSAPGMAAIVSDNTVYALYGERTVKALEKAGYRVHSFTFPAGEGSKNLSTYADVLHFLGEHRFSRSDVVVALGGGVVGDLAGFAAATVKDANDVEVRLAQSHPDDDIREPHFVIEIFPIFLPWTVEETKAKQ